MSPSRKVQAERSQHLTEGPVHKWLPVTEQLLLCGWVPPSASGRLRRPGLDGEGASHWTGAWTWEECEGLLIRPQFLILLVNSYLSFSSKAHWQRSSEAKGWLLQADLIPTGTSWVKGEGHRILHSRDPNPPELLCHSPAGCLPRAEQSDKAPG